MQSEGSAVSDTAGNRGPAFPELLHALAQPLTSLRCSLETTLLLRRDTDEYRKSLRDSLQLAEEVSAWAAGIRELLDAESAPRTTESVCLRGVLEEVVNDRRHVAESRGQQIRLSCNRGFSVSGNLTQYVKAFTYLVDYAFEVGPFREIVISIIQQGPVIHIWVRCHGSASRGFKPRATPAARPLIGFSDRARDSGVGRWLGGTVSGGERHYHQGQPEKPGLIAALLLYCSRRVQHA